MRLLRSAVLLLGLGVVASLGTVEWALRRHDRSRPTLVREAAAQDASAALVLPVSRTVERVRVALGVIGIGIAVFGVYVTFRDVAPASYLGLALWLVAAIVLHDAVLVPVLTALRAASRRAGRRLPVAAVWIAETGFLVGGAITVLAVPEIHAQRRGTLNPTVLPGAYGTALLVTWAVIVLVTACAVAILALTARRGVVAQPSPPPVAG